MIIGVVDVETTGLDPQEDQLLELAILVYRHREPDLPDGLVAVHHAVFFRSPHSAEVLAPAVVEMHTKNGLFAECQKSQLFADDHSLALAPQLPEKMILYGRNVHFDLAFLKWRMPEVAARFTHRHLDLTTIDYLRGRSVRPASTHRALHDAMAELLELVVRPAVGRSVLEEVLVG